MPAAFGAVVWVGVAFGAAADAVEAVLVVDVLPFGLVDGVPERPPGFRVENGHASSSSSHSCVQFVPWQNSQL